ncbi:MAG: ABC transporter ATP-binding protein [Candidatus Ancillula sp.]|nr:ABC transporter ATP-binding protein [Candidatus Ancillula sp.]
MGDVEISALKRITFSVKKGEICCILGSSGAGKTTLLNILGGMDTSTSGHIQLFGEEISNYNARQLTAYRRNDIGFVFQFYNLVPNLTALENVELATQICENALDSAQILKDVGLEHRMNNFPAQLSGGEQQRVAIARALAKNPKLLLCDEPTGALDFTTGRSILQLLEKMSRELDMSIIIVTHNAEICKMSNRVVYIKDGEIDSVEVNRNPISAEEIEW